MPLWEESITLNDIAASESGSRDPNLIHLLVVSFAGEEDPVLWNPDSSSVTRKGLKGLWMTVVRMNSLTGFISCECSPGTLSQPCVCFMWSHAGPRVLPWSGIELQPSLLLSPSLRQARNSWRTEAGPVLKQASKGKKWYLSSSLGRQARALSTLRCMGPKGLCSPSRLGDLVGEACKWAGEEGWWAWFVALHQNDSSGNQGPQMPSWQITYKTREQTHGSGKGHAGACSPEDVSPYSRQVLILHLLLTTPVMGLTYWHGSDWLL